MTWENFANVLLHMELLLRRASRKCVQNEDGTVSWTEPMTWMCRSKDSAPFEDLYNVSAFQANVSYYLDVYIDMRAILLFLQYHHELLVGASVPLSC